MGGGRHISDEEREGIHNLIRLRETEAEIVALDERLRDERLLSDAEQLKQAGKLLALTRITGEQYVLRDFWGRRN